MLSEEITLSGAMIAQMAIFSIHKDANEPYLGLDFSIDGELLAAHTSKDLFIFELSSGKKICELENRVSEISLLRFLHSGVEVIFAPSGMPFDLFVWAFFENKILRSYVGGNASLISLHVNRHSNLVLSVDSSRRLRIYDLEVSSSSPSFTIDAKEELSLAANFDCSGLVLLTAKGTKTPANQNIIELHNIEKKYQGVFKRITLKGHPPLTNIQFDESRCKLLCVTIEGTVVLMDTKTEVVRVLSLNLGTKIPQPEATFSSDSRWILAGGEEGTVRVFEAQGGCEEVASLWGHIGPCMLVRFARNFLMFASACQNLVFWIPKHWEIEE